jgi:hypothetical protein
VGAHLVAKAWWTSNALAGGRGRRAESARSQSLGSRWGPEVMVLTAKAAVSPDWGG